MKDKKEDMVYEHTLQRIWQKVSLRYRLTVNLSFLEDGREDDSTDRQEVGELVLT